MARKTLIKGTDDNRPQKESKSTPTPMSAPKKLQLLFTVVNREKTEFYVDLLSNFEVNMQMVLSAQGTAKSSTLDILGLTDSERSVIISTIKRERVKEALDTLDEKFRTVKNGKGIAYTVPISSTIGVAIYQFLSNTANGGIR